MNNYWYAVIGYAFLIFILSSIPLAIGQGSGFDKVIHAIEYAIFGVILYMAMSHSKSKSIVKNAVLLVLVIGVFYAISDEIHQYFVPNRSMDAFDALADSVGVLVGAILAKLKKDRQF